MSSSIVGPSRWLPGFTAFSKKRSATLCREIQRIRHGKAYRLYIPEEMGEFNKAGAMTEKGVQRYAALPRGSRRRSFSAFVKSRKVKEWGKLEKPG